MGRVEKLAAFGLRILEMAQEHLGVAIEVVARILLLRLQEDVAVGDKAIGASGSLNGMSITWSMPRTYMARRSSP
jgi:hypothetical protein